MGGIGKSRPADKLLAVDAWHNPEHRECFALRATVYPVVGGW